MRVGIVGATGAVGRQMITCLEERKIDVEELRLFASSRSLGKKIPYLNQEITIQEVADGCFDGLDYVLGAVSNALSKEYRPMIEKAGAVYIDNSSAFRMEDDVPLVVPQINGEDALKHHGTIANPNCSAIITLMALAPICRLSKIKTINACTYQAVSGAGMHGIEELENQCEAIRNHEEVEVHTFPSQIAYNVIADIGSVLENGYTTEEMKMQNEGRKILHLPDLKVTCTCVRVPVYRSHSISATVVCEERVSIEEAEKAIDAFDGDVLYKGVPTPLLTTDQDLVYVGRIREDLTNENGLVIWCCGDQIRKGAASNAVEIMEYLMKHECVTILKYKGEKIMSRKSILAFSAIALAAASALAAYTLKKSKKTQENEEDDEIHFIKIEDGDVEEKKVDPSFEEKSDEVKEVASVYPYLDLDFIEKILNKNDEFNSSYEEDSLVTVMHHVRFAIAEERKAFEEIMGLSGYETTTQDDKVVATRKFFTQPGAIISDILNVANQTNALQGVYENYDIR